MYPKFDQTRVRNDLQIIQYINYFHVTETPALTTWPSVTYVII